MRLSELDTSKRHSAAVLSILRITPPAAAEDVRELVLEIDADGFKVAPGQTIGVMVPGPHALGHKQHFRLYTVASTPAPAAVGKPRIDICVKRCRYIDDYSGESYDGIASNYLCDRLVGDVIAITGPYGLPFTVPADRSANLLMIGMGTGIAPFRAFVRHIYEHVGQWQGKVRLVYGAHSGLETLYMNDERDDFANYYDQPTFQAFKALSPRPHWGVPIAMEVMLMAEKAELWALLCDPKTYVYVAGLSEIGEALDKTFAGMAGGADKWVERKKQMVSEGRWTELLYG